MDMGVDEVVHVDGSQWRISGVYATRILTSICCWYGLVGMRGRGWALTSGQFEASTSHCLLKLLLPCLNNSTMSFQGHLLRSEFVMSAENARDSGQSSTNTSNTQQHSQQLSSRVAGIIHFNS